MSAGLHHIPSFTMLGGSGYIGSMRWILLLAVCMTAGCTGTTIPTETPSTTNIPASISLTSSVSTGPAPAGSIQAIVLDISSMLCVGVTVSFSASTGFITTPVVTDSVGAAGAVLSGVPAGTAVTVNASVPVPGSTTPVTASIVMHF
jgi:hypothetical protein